MSVRPSLVILLLFVYLASGWCSLLWDCQPGGPQNNIIPEDHINKTCREHGGYRSLYYSDNWGQGIYYNDENKFLSNARSPGAVTGTIRRIYRQNETYTILQEGNKQCDITQAYFMIDIGVSCVLKHPAGIKVDLPNPLVMKYECDPLGFKENDDVILIIGSITYECSGITGRPCTEKWSYGQLAYYRRNEDTLTKLMRVCGYQNPKGNGCPPVRVTPQTCSMGRVNAQSLLAVLLAVVFSSMYQRST